jgi:hypothetical protein
MAERIITNNSNSGELAKLAADLQDSTVDAVVALQSELDAVDLSGIATNASAIAALPQTITGSGQIAAAGTADVVDGAVDSFTLTANSKVFITPKSNETIAFFVAIDDVANTFTVTINAAGTAVANWDFDYLIVG